MDSALFPRPANLTSGARMLTHFGVHGETPEPGIKLSILVKYFASVRELVGKAEDAVDCDSIHSVNDVWARSANRSMPANLLVAINQEHAQLGDVVKDGDEVAFFPPVTGG